MYGPEVRLSVRSQLDGVGEVLIRFAELPVAAWYSLSPADKRKKGITRAAGVSVIRARREIDYGWFFMGGKRRENYDDWWRCEIEFSPVLDEEFGVSHTKQQIRPSDALIAALTPVIEPVARVLSRRARDSYLQLASEEREKNPLIEFAEDVNDVLPTSHIDLGSPPRAMRMAITSGERSTQELYSTIADRTIGLTLSFNSSHVFYRRIHDAAAQGDRVAKKIEESLEILLLAATKAESVLDEQDVLAVQRFRAQWGKILTCYTNRKL